MRLALDRYFTRAAASRTGACGANVETPSRDLPLVPGAIRRQMTNATAVRIAPNNMVVPIPSDEMLSGRKYRVDRLLFAVLVPHQTFIAQFRIPEAIILLADYFHGMPELEEIEAPGVDIARAAWIIDLFNRSGRKAITPVRRNPGANR